MCNRNYKKYNLNDSSDKIYYKGELLLKNEILSNYLSKISDDYTSDKEEEKARFIRYYYLSEYSNELSIKSGLKSKLFDEISRLKNQTINKIDNFFLSRICNFGNSLITINNAKP